MEKEEQEGVMSEWQPIETAPKDGTIFLSFDVTMKDPGRHMHWGQGYGLYNFEGDRVPSFQPTHWMPLPPPPKPIEQEA